jgi:hypothetical protein
MRAKEHQEGEKEFFSRIFGSEFDEFLGKERSVWEIEIFEEIKLMRGSTFQEVRTRSKKQTRWKMKANSFKFFINILSLKEA